LNVFYTFFARQGPEAHGGFMRSRPRLLSVSDLIYIGIAALFFWLTWGLVVFCERLERSNR